MTRIAELPTPVALLDLEQMDRNIRRMQSHLDDLGVPLRPHVKTSKCPRVVAAQLAAGGRGITVSTLKEAEQFFAAGVRDIVYAVGVSPDKLPAVLALRQRGCELKIVTDNADAAAAIVAAGRAAGTTLEVWLEIDTDGHRSGLAPEGEALLAVGRTLHAGGIRLGGVLTHAGASYECDTPAALERMAEQERAGAVRAATRLRAAGLPCPVVSVGSTPTALAAVRREGVTEVRAGVYVFFDLVMHEVGVCRLDEIALSVLTTVIGHQVDKGWAIVDAGWMALSRDRGTQARRRDYGYGQVCDAGGTPLPGYVVTSTNQEHGVVARTGAPDRSIAARLPVGTRLRILPNHACATAAQHPEYAALAPNGEVERWPRFYGW
ncbi:MAG: alanine racemase [Proteobacteria bacterium]|nr:alanine racemase [Pseudomonadota bacterium]